MSFSFQAHDTDPAPRTARLFRNGSNQAVRIPREFELTGEAVMIQKEGGRLILEPLPRQPSLLGVLATLEPLDEAFPDVDESLPSLEDVDVD